MDQQNPSGNLWAQMLARDPGHSHRYAQRWRDLAAEGMDLDGEARLVDAVASRGARILDAGCGTGRVGGYLARVGHEVVGVDLDPHLIEVARADYPRAEWHVADLEDLDLVGLGEDRPFDIVVSAGNVFGFLDPQRRRDALGHLAAALAPTGRALVGFGAGRGYEFTEFETDVEAAGLCVQARFSTWQLDPCGTDADFLVAFLVPA